MSEHGDGYGTMMREIMKKSMKEPAKRFVPLNRRVDPFEALIDRYSKVIGWCIAICIVTEVFYHGIKYLLR